MAKNPRLIDRMKDRRLQGLTFRELGDEFDMSHTHARNLTLPMPQVPTPVKLNEKV